MNMFGKITLPSDFSDNMVLQQNSKVASVDGPHLMKKQTGS
jgi:hypothetical protein